MTRNTTLLCGLCIVMCVVVWRVFHRGTPEATLLPDGSCLEFCGVTVGTNHSFHFGTLRQRLLARLPDPVGRRFGGRERIVSEFGRSSNVVFWFRRTHAPWQTNRVKVAQSWMRAVAQNAVGINSGPFTNVVSMAPVTLYANLKDDRGDGEPGFSQFNDTGFQAEPAAMYWRTSLVPSQTPTIELWFYGHPSSRTSPGSGLRQCGKMILPNPFYCGP